MTAAGAPLRPSPSAARSFLVRRHRLAPPRAHENSVPSLAALVDALGSLQFDPLETPGARNHDLVLHARVRGYARGDVEALLYPPPGSPRILYEGYNKSLNVLPVAELAAHRVSWERARERYATRITKDLAREVRAVLAQIDAKGPQTAQELAATVPGRVPWHWAETNTARAVCEALFEMGTLGIAKREGNRRWFDRIERLLPPEVLAQKGSTDEALAHRLRSRVRGLGLLGPSGSPELFTGTAPSAERKRSLEALAERGSLVRVHVEGLRGLRYAPAEELPLLEACMREEPANSPAEVTFLAPLDPLVWDRDLLRALFDFDYKWEVYTPESQRSFGYYVLPVLYGERLVARVEPVLDRAERTLTLAGVWEQPNQRLAADPAFVSAFARALHAYARFVRVPAPSVRFPRTRLGRVLRDGFTSTGT